MRSSEADEEHGLKTDVPVPAPRQQQRRKSIFLACISIITFLAISVYLFWPSKPTLTPSSDTTTTTSAFAPILDTLQPTTMQKTPEPTPPNCLPRICQTKESFVMNNNFTMLVSYPGSGNTWTRAIIEAGTRVWTGSVYRDPTLIRDGFEGESVSVYGLSKSKFSAIKSHYPYLRAAPMPKPMSGAIVVIRSPFDSLLAEFQRLFGPKGWDKHVNQVSHEKLLGAFPHWLSSSTHRWAEFAHYWMQNHTVQVDVDGVSYIQYRRLLPNGRKMRILVMFYEDFVRRDLAATSKMFTFLKQEMGEAMPTTVDEAVVCAWADARKQAKVKRAHAADAYNVYQDPANNVAQRNLVAKACVAWRKYWVQDLWGDCREPVPQVRRLPIVKSELAKRLDAACNNEEEVENVEPSEEEGDELDLNEDFEATMNESEEQESLDQFDDELDT